MRYLRQDKITYTDITGTNWEIKNWRPIPDYDTDKIIELNLENNEIDEIASRQENFGNENEFMSYAIVDFNIVKLMENNFCVGNLKSLKIPVVTDII